MPVCGSGAVVSAWSLLIRRPQRARRQAETPLIVLCRFPGPALQVEYRPVFNERKKAIRRNVQIIQHPKHEGSFAAQDTKSCIIVLVHQDRERLRELCEWMGWRVVAARYRSSE
jgi:hypothetical protein